MSRTWLVPRDQRLLTPDRYHAGHRPERIQPIELAVWHYTASRKFRATKAWLTRRDRNYVSAHFVIRRDGVIFQLAPLEDRTFHAGGRTSTFMGRGRVNDRSIGIECMNLGPITQTAEGFGDYLGRPVRADQVRVGPDGDYWHLYTELQIAAIEHLAEELSRHFPLLGQEPETRHVGHEHVDPERKIDPGPLFPWSEVFRAATMGLDDRDSRPTV